MTTSAFATPGAPPRLTYARARLLLGISGVGTAVLTAAALLALDVPRRVLSASAEQPMPEAVASLALLVAFGALVFLPFDVMGGHVMVRQRRGLAAFLAGWVRGVGVQLVAWALAATVLMLAARIAGVAGAIGSLVVLQVLLAQYRASFARMIASFTVLPAPERVRRAAEQAGIAPDRVMLVDTADEGFVGGWSGIVPRTLLLPARWLELPDAALTAVLRRRRLLAESGAHLRGVLGAIAWNTLGFTIVLALSGADVGSAAGVLSAAAGMTLWGFLGVLLLPTPSRAAVYALDAMVAREDGDAPLRDAIERLDRWQDDEERRPVGVEAIFHPVPSRSARDARLRAAAGTRAPARGGSAWATHHLARHALWLSWASLAPIARLVHCNVGRPALWAMLPGD